MSTLTINTHQAFRTLVQSGITEKQAEAHINVLEDIDTSALTTKADLLSTKNDLEKGMLALESRIYKFILLNSFVIIGTMVAITKFL